MEARAHKSLLSWSGILVLGVIVLLLNGVSSVAFRRFYVDLTEEGLYSLSAGTKNIVNNIDEPITLHFYFSRTDSAELSTIKLYGSRILDLLKQYERVGKGKIILQTHDPRPDTEDEEWAQKYGLQPMQLREGENIFLGLAGVSSVGAEQVIPMFNFQRQEFLEYDITKLLFSLISDAKPKIGILSSIDVKGSPAPQMPGMPPTGSEPWFFTTQLEGVAQLVYLDKNITSIADDIQVLMLIHPKELPDQALYAIDQFVLRGGKLFAFTDPYCNSDKTASDPSNPMAAMTANKSSNLNRLLEKWGVKQLEGKAVADINLATKVNAGGGSVKDFVLWLSLAKGEMSDGDVATSALDSLLMPWAGALELNKIEGITTETLMKTSERAMLVEDKDFRFGGGEPDNILRSYVPGGKSYVLAARISGKFKTNFPDGKPAAADKDGENKAPPPVAESSTASTHLKESTGESNVVIVSDADMLSDQYSLLSQSVFGRRFISPLNDNQSFVQNVAENLAGSNDLISIRSRGKFTRPFTRVDALSRDASLRLQQEEGVFQAKLNAANQRLAQLQATTQGGDQKASQQILSGAVRDEIKQLRAEKSEAQKRLREVRRSLREDVERLGTRLFLLNTFLVPILLVVGSLGWFITKRRREAGR